MSDIRATLLKKFEARKPPSEGIVFDGEKYVSEPPCHRDSRHQGVIDERNLLWKECQAAYAEAVRDCAELLDSMSKDPLEQSKNTAKFDMENRCEFYGRYKGLYDGAACIRSLTDERSSDGR